MVYTRCSPAIVSDILLDLDMQRMALLKEMSFSGLANLSITKTNKQFGAWLLSRFDPIASGLYVGSNSFIKMTCQDINLDLGIPCEGKDIAPATQQEVVTMKKYLCNVFDKDSFDQITMSYICSIVDKIPDGPMTAKEIVQFKTAFILFVVTKFLAPVSLNNYISSRYMAPLVDIENVHTYNWATFVLDEIKLAAATLQDKLHHKKPAGYVNSCITLLQVYLCSQCLYHIISR